MSWDVDGSIVAEPTGAQVTAARAPDGAHFDIEVAFRVAAWTPDRRGRLPLLPQPADVLARTKGGDLRLGYATPSPSKTTPRLRRSGTRCR